MPLTMNDCAELAGRDWRQVIGVRFKVVFKDYDGSEDLGPVCHLETPQATTDAELLTIVTADTARFCPHWEEEWAARCRPIGIANRLNTTWKEL